MGDTGDVLTYSILWDSIAFNWTFPESQKDNPSVDIEFSLSHNLVHDPTHTKNIWKRFVGLKSGVKYDTRSPSFDDHEEEEDTRYIGGSVGFEVLKTVDPVTQKPTIYRDAVLLVKLTVIRPTEFCERARTDEAFGKIPLRSLYNSSKAEIVVELLDLCSKLGQETFGDGKTEIDPGWHVGSLVLGKPHLSISKSHRAHEDMVGGRRASTPDIIDDDRFLLGESIDVVDWVPSPYSTESHPSAYTPDEIRNISDAYTMRYYKNINKGSPVVPKVASYNVPSYGHSTMWSSDIHKGSGVQIAPVAIPAPVWFNRDVAYPMNPEQLDRLIAIALHSNDISLDQFVDAAEGRLDSEIPTAVAAAFDSLVQCVLSKPYAYDAMRRGKPIRKRKYVNPFSGSSPDEDSGEYGELNQEQYVMEDRVSNPDIADFSQPLDCEDGCGHVVYMKHMVHHMIKTGKYVSAGARALDAILRWYEFVDTRLYCGDEGAEVKDCRKTPDLDTDKGVCHVLAIVAPLAYALQGLRNGIEVALSKGLCKEFTTDMLALRNHIDRICESNPVARGEHPSTGLGLHAIESTNTSVAYLGLMNEYFSDKTRSSARIQGMLKRKREFQELVSQKAGLSPHGREEERSPIGTNWMTPMTSKHLKKQGPEDSHNLFADSDRNRLYHFYLYAMTGCVSWYGALQLSENSPTVPSTSSGDIMVESEHSLLTEVAFSVLYDGEEIDDIKFTYGEYLQKLAIYPDSMLLIPVGFMKKEEFGPLMQSMLTEPPACYHTANDSRVPPVSINPKNTILLPDDIRAEMPLRRELVEKYMIGPDELRAKLNSVYSTEVDPYALYTQLYIHGCSPTFFSTHHITQLLNFLKEGGGHRRFMQFAYVFATRTDLVVVFGDDTKTKLRLEHVPVKNFMYALWIYTFE